MNFVKTISSSILNNKLMVKFLRMGRSDIRESKQVTPFGVDSTPVKDAIAAYSETSVLGEDVVIGYIVKSAGTEPGELKIFSTDDAAAEQIFIHLKKNGTILFGGDTDNLTRFTPISQTVTELQNDVNELKNLITSWVPVAGDGGAALKVVLAAWYASPLVENIADAKIDEFKTL